MVGSTRELYLPGYHWVRGWFDKGAIQGSYTSPGYHWVRGWFDKGAIPPWVPLGAWMVRQGSYTSPGTTGCVDGWFDKGAIPPQVPLGAWMVWHTLLARQ